MPETNSISSNFAVSGFWGGNFDTSTIQDEHKKKPNVNSIFNAPPNPNLENSNACIW